MEPATPNTAQQPSRDNAGVRPRLTPKHKAALAALASVYRDDQDFSYLGFKGIARRAREEGHVLPEADVRRTVRHLARRGWAVFGKGLWTEDGEVAGSGYAITPAGMAVFKGEAA